MRIWEAEDSRAVPSNLVREQDFILRIRRIHRIGAQYLVVNLPLSAIDHAYGGRGPLEEAQERLQDFAKDTSGAYIEMSNGDVFLLWPETEAAKSLVDKALTVALPGGVAPEDVAKCRLVYRLPAEYAPLRERANHYVDVSRDTTSENAENTPAQLLQSETARGPMTAWSADQIGKLLEDIDIHRYLRTQPVYERGQDGVWRPLFVELFIGIDDLRLAHFPKMEIAPSEHLFLELCQKIDRRLLTQLSQHSDIIVGHSISLNLSVSSLTGPAFAQFAFTVPRANRGTIICELNGADLWQDFTMTIGVMGSLRKEGFKIAIDGVSPAMLPYVNLGLFEPNYIKINASKDQVASLAQPQTRAALDALPREKLIFFRCDNEQAVTLGQELGVSRFQGWLIDDLVKQD
jgi:EAL domain-containing protein (putative c-di-GMP-specific phosphodiesterase class I)